MGWWYTATLYADTVSKYTIISPAMYQRQMGEVVPARCALRAWGASGNLDVKGMVKTELTTAKGATRATWVYRSHGYQW